MPEDADQPTPTPESTSPVPDRARGRRWRRILGFSALGLAGLVLVAQLVPFGHSYVPVGHPKGNPPVTKAAVWPDPAGQTIAEHACYDCHSNLTNWWLGTKIAPMSWLAQSDVDGGREALNFSEWDRAQPAVDEVVETVDGGMPPLQYSLVHPKARLSAADKATLIAGLRSLYRVSPPAGIKSGG